MSRGTRAALAAIVVSAGLAGEAGAATPVMLEADAGKHKGYATEVFARTNGTNSTGVTSVTLLDERKKSLQMHIWAFRRGVKLTFSKDLRSGTYEAKLGEWGRVRLTFRATRRLGAVKPPEDCKARKGKKVMGRAGVLKGTFTFDTRSDTLRKIARRSIKATAYDARTVTCDMAGSEGLTPDDMPKGGAVLVTTNATPDTPMLIAGGNGKEAGLIALLEESRRAAGMYAMHILAAETAPSSFTFPSDLTSARLLGEGPFNGSLDFTAQGQPKPDEGAEGVVKGDMVANFDAPGPRPLAPGEGVQAMLMPTGS
jgi:hypothetical protein